MTRPAVLALAVLALTGCSFPGQERSEVVSRETVTIGEQSCALTSRRNEVNTVNGIHTYYDFVADCGGDELVCETGSRDECIAALGTSLAA